MTYSIGIISLCYFLILLFLLFGFLRHRRVFRQPNTPHTSFSIIIVFRNEEKNLPQLLRSLKKLQYPITLFEVILVNDHSKDNSEAFCKQFIIENPSIQVSLLQNNDIIGSPKKNAITKALGVATGNYILTTDADCVVPASWLLEYDSSIQTHQADLIAGPVRVLPGSGFWTRFDELDMWSLQGATMGSFGAGCPLMCNGANLCFQRTSFYKVSGYEGNINISSGDDIFLLEKFRKMNFKNIFLKSREVIVHTRSQGNLKNMLAQRVRWAAKTSSHPSLFVKSVGVVVFLMNFGIILGLFFAFLGTLPWEIPLAMFFLKISIDFFLISLTAAFFKAKRSLFLYFPASLIYPFFNFWIVLKSLFLGYTWKDRHYKK